MAARDMTGMVQTSPQTERLRILMTAAEAYPALEACFLTARDRISAGFRVFDPATTLRSPEAREIGERWVDLIVHTLARGVNFRIVIADFDPVARPGCHRRTWRSVRQLLAAGEASGRPELLSVIPAMHPARVGAVPRFFLWPRILRELNAEARRLNHLAAAPARATLAEMPAIRDLVQGRHPELRARRWPIAPLVPASHHQKVAVFDGQTLFVGGLDLNDRRYDTPDHDRPGEDTWHDVQLLMRGEVAAEAERHLDEMLDVVAARKPPARLPTLLRTLSCRRRWPSFTMSPRTLLAEIEAAHLRRIKEARQLIYLETQFFRSLPLARALAEAARRSPALGLLLVVPGAPHSVAFEDSSDSGARYGEYLQARCVKTVCDAFGARCFVMAPAQPRRSRAEGRETLQSAPLVYLHAKVSIFDERVAIVSSANLNGRSMRWDTELGISLDRAEDVAALRRRCFEHWLPEDADPDCFDPASAVTAWRDLAQANAGAPPEARRGFLLPYSVGPARRFGRNLPGVPDEMV
ncbi:MAG: phospholipase [Sedimentitalea sp.]|nr:phospholipase [Sedimentitalea sp.]